MGNTQLAISTANSVRQMADGTVVCEGHGPDGGTVMVVMREQSVDMHWMFGAAAWHMTLTKIDGDGDGVVTDVESDGHHQIPMVVSNNHVARTRVSKPRELCPLCGGKRHWKDGGRPGSGSYTECAWRQWARDMDKLVDPSNPESKGNDPEHTAGHEREFKAWLAQQPKDRMFGSVHAERIIRQRRREQQKQAHNHN